ncbi:MAG: type II toxin-antitoxin system HicB family antitoxin [candidate division NC10 bacterium]|jgi:predicted RNase H-like HicB family nuclease
MKYRVKLEQTDEGYSVWCPGLPGCCSQGDTDAEALENIKGAIATYVATAAEMNADAPPRSVEVDA